jgi:DNA-binding transcriptional regulator YiaG
MDYSKVLVKMRKETGMSQKEFAAYTYTPLSTYKKWEQGVRRVPENYARLTAYMLTLQKRISPETADMAGKPDDTEAE